MRLVELNNFKKFSNISVNFNESGLTLLSGPNNSGKTSILHALAVWEYAKMLLVNYRGAESLTKEYDVKRKGLGIPPESFTPISIPSLKYLWKDQKADGSYRLKIKVGWEGSGGRILFLEIAYTLNGNNFAIKKSDSNISTSDVVPIVAYLPPFGGMSENESWLSKADRRKLIGKGQAGSVIRNLLLDLHEKHETILREKRQELFPNKRKLSKADKEKLERVDTEWRQLKSILSEVFHVHLLVRDFDSQFHNFITIDVLDLITRPGTKEKIRNGLSKRDLMVEGSGFLQWLSVFALALDRNNNILVLDEPDAHLHSSLQSLLLEKLEKICEESAKTILMVSHSPDLIKQIDYKKVLYVQNSKAGYLEDNNQKIVVIEGLGSKYHPRVEAILEHKKVLFVENQSDARVLKAFCNALGKKWPDNLYVWPLSSGHKERKPLIKSMQELVLKDAREQLKTYSLCDRDDKTYASVDRELSDPSYRDSVDCQGVILYRTLRRREIENYLIIPEAISRYISDNCKNPNVEKSVEAVNRYLADQHGIVVPDTYRLSDKENNTEALFNNDVKPVLEGINKHFKVKFSKQDYVAQISEGEICDDMSMIVDQIISMCS